MPDKRYAINYIGSNSRLSIPVKVFDRIVPFQVLARINIAAILPPILECLCLRFQSSATVPTIWLQIES